MKNFLPWYILIAAGWAIINGILHDIFVIKKHPVYDRDLMHLLIDGHILIFAGIFYLLSFYGIRQFQTWGFYVGILAAVFLLGYCAIIFKMLPSVMTILINLIALIMLIIYIPKS